LTDACHNGQVPESRLRPDYPIRTARLLLRPLTGADAVALAAYRGRADVCRYVPFSPMTPADIAGRLTGQWARTALTDEGQSLTLGAQVAGTGELAGDVMLFWHSRQHGGGELGYVFNPDLGGRGYATEAARAMLRLGFEGLGLHRITARLDERNEPSARLARRLGMRQEARLVENELFKGEWSTELDFAMLASEWSSQHGVDMGPAELPRPVLERWLSHVSLTDSRRCAKAPFEAVAQQAKRAQVDRRLGAGRDRDAGQGVQVGRVKVRHGAAQQLADVLPRKVMSFQVA
jgi:RimJ/RimL family protein N-acetyltransferase